MRVRERERGRQDFLLQSKITFDRLIMLASTVRWALAIAKYNEGREVAAPNA